MFRLKSVFKICRTRRFSTVPPVNVLEHLQNRSLIRVSDSEVSNFLQGLITNDIKHLDHGVGSMYTMFLNTKGRVMYDAILYRTLKENIFLIECDSQAIDSLQKHLKFFRVKRKIDIVSLSDELSVYVVFNPNRIVRNNSTQEDTHSKKLEGFIVPCSSLKETLPETSSTCKVHKDLLIYCDPRISSLGLRIIAPQNCDIKKQVSEIIHIDITSQPQCPYRRFRYNLGVGEGVCDLPPGECFPLEANCDYLHGVSFHKGCYIGQELTARTHHTGVVRKRLMPLYFSKIPTKLPEDNKIVHESLNLGKLRGVEEDVGLGLLRISKALELREINIGNGIAMTRKPTWWPFEAPKERLDIQKN